MNKLLAVLFALTILLSAAGSAETAIPESYNWTDITEETAVEGTVIEVSEYGFSIWLPEGWETKDSEYGLMLLSADGMQGLVVSQVIKRNSLMDDPENYLANYKNDILASQDSQIVSVNGFPVVNSFDTLNGLVNLYFISDHGMINIMTDMNPESKLFVTILSSLQLAE